NTAGQRIEAFTDLAVGDYVVHEHHGVGVYQGTVRLQSEGAWRDYLLIHYRGNDKLYVPLDQFERVQKYIGAGDNTPHLNDLGSSDWEKQRKKVKSGLQKLAFDLVKLYAARQTTDGFSFPSQPDFESQFNDYFEYELTPDQEKSVSEILDDMSRSINMDRLLCGDVGYGKTEVAVRAAFRAVINSRQVAFLAPTTILVQQHYETLKKRFEQFPISIEYVSRFRSAKANKETLLKASRGELDILIGTHRLLSKDVNFKNLGLLIVDEEQRFGVAHKEGIKNYKKTVDVLTLSATPIPRTLHMSMVGVRDLSLLESPPLDRFPVQTYVVDYSDTLIRDAILREKNRDGQVFFLYNRVADIERFASQLRQLVPEVKIAVAHGQMRENALEDVMVDFIAGQYDVLLCTTIIENGIDIPKANTIIIYNADHFGLSQLYQLRGRVGRSNRSAYAYFTVKPDKVLSETAEKRLAAIKEFTEFGSGFRIALRDLSIRGAGNMLGPEQSGQVSTVGYDLYCKMIEEAVREEQGDISGKRESELDTHVELHVKACLPEN
ncbi:MAG: transcription-repair coupling factor, partial [Clostridiales bacterium]|nr:transcription-repair coupling factor [Clostridiales bacterium]